MAIGHPQTIGDCFDVSSFTGRVLANWAVFNPLNLRFGQQDVHRALVTLSTTSSSYEERKQALIVRAACAPAGELLPWPLRACGWALGGTPIIAFMVSNAVHHPLSLFRIFLGQFLNQTHLAGCTYCNRGGSAGMGPASIAQAYCISIATSVPIAFAAAVSARRWQVLRPFARFAPYPGVAAANAIACITMRQSDVQDGIPVRVVNGAAGSGGGGDAPGVVGLSRHAGWAAVRDTALTRLSLPLGNFVLVPSLLYALQRWRGRGPNLAVQVGVTAAVFCLWLPLATSSFPAEGCLPVADLEPEVRARLDAHTRVVVYQRGV